jgi:5-methylcytosine-specific restriction protein A
MANWPYNTAAWQRLRKAKLSRDPLCEDCQAMGRITPANHVDHCHAINDGGDAFPPLDELSSKCASCHSAKTARGAEAGAVRSNKPRRGCDANGNPLDSNHAWADKVPHSAAVSGGKSLRADAKGPPRNYNFELVLGGPTDGR